MKLTKRALDSFKYEGTNNSRDVRWDDLLPGFGVRIYPSGKKAFVLSYRVAGRKRMFTIGRYGVYTLIEAQDEARNYLRNVTKNNDPLDERQRKAKGETVKDLCDEYMERHAKPRKKSWADDQARINNYILPAWGSRKADSIKRFDMANMHSKLGKDGHPYGANRILRLVSKIYSLARQWGYVPDDYPNPSRDIELFKEHKRDRWVTPAELPKLIEAINIEGNVSARNALWLYLLTGVRKSELLKSKWSDIDWDRKELKLPDTKAGRTHYVPLSEPAMSILREIPRIKGNPYILPGKKEKSHLVNIDKPWIRAKSLATTLLFLDEEDTPLAELIQSLKNKLQRQPTLPEIIKAADFELPTGLQDVRLHDLRRTVGSWMAQSGNSLHLIGKVLNHSNQSTTAIYARFAEDQTRNALEQHGKQIMGVANNKPTNVVALKK